MKNAIRYESLYWENEKENARARACVCVCVCVWGILVDYYADPMAVLILRHEWYTLRGGDGL